MYVCARVRVCVVCLCLCVCVSVRACLPASVCVFVRVCVRTCFCVTVRACLCVSVSVSLCVPVCVLTPEVFLSRAVVFRVMSLSAERGGLRLPCMLSPLHPSSGSVKGCDRASTRSLAALSLCWSRGGGKGVWGCLWLYYGVISWHGTRQGLEERCG